MNKVHEGIFRYTESGSKSPLILLHGLFGELSNFNSVVEHFQKNYRVIVPELPLYELGPDDCHIPALVEFTRDFTDYLGLKSFALLGNSLGGHIALLFAGKYPERVEKLVLTGSSGLYENAFGKTVPRRYDKTYIHSTIERTFYDPRHATDELVERCYRILSNQEKLGRIIKFSKSSIRQNLHEVLPDVNIPACLIWGRNDRITPPSVAETFKQRMPRASLFWIDACGHAPMMERPQEFNSILEDWLLSERSSDSGSCVG